LIEVTPPHAQWWNFELGNCWWETMDYRHHVTNLNSSLSRLEDDGRLIVAISRDDPGLANWLDACGHDEGYVTVRWVQADAYPTPRCRVVKHSELASALPAGARRASSAERRAQLRVRQLGLERRLRT